jgi:branched-chain amino acid transport system ATP-binding protein
MSQSNDAILSVREVSVRFGGLKAVDSVSLDVNRQEVVGLIGPNGAGKTTLFQAISGFVRKEGGDVRFRGERIDAIPPEQICRRGLTRTFQVSEVFPSLTVRECLTAAALVRLPLSGARELARSISSLVHLDQKLDVACSELTLPDQKALEIGKAMATQPQMILLDEVMAGLRPSETQDVVRLIRNLRDDHGITFLVVEHNMDVIMGLSDRVVVMSAGQKIIEGSPEQIASAPKVIEIYLGEEFALA